MALSLYWVTFTRNCRPVYALNGCQEAESMSNKVANLDWLQNMLSSHLNHRLVVLVVILTIPDKQKKSKQWKWYRRSWCKLPERVVFLWKTITMWLSQVIHSVHHWQCLRRNADFQGLVQAQNAAVNPCIGQSKQSSALVAESISAMLVVPVDGIASTRHCLCKRYASLMVEKHKTFCTPNSTLWRTSAYFFPPVWRVE